MATYLFLMECITDTQREQSFMQSQTDIVYQALRYHHDCKADESMTEPERRRHVAINRFYGYNSIRELLRHSTSEDDVRFQLQRGLRAAAEGRLWTEHDLKFLDDMIADGIKEYERA